MIIPNWTAPQNVKAVSSTRIGGFSTGVYQGLNLGQHVGDDPETVTSNRLLFAQKAGMPSTPIWLNQTHSTHVVTLDKPTTDVLDGDAAFTSVQGVICSIMTADCLPVLLCNTSGTQVCAVHAGWRGLAGGIIESAVSQFTGPVIAWLGPAIGPSAFEVGEDVVNAFCSFDAEALSAFKPRTISGKWLADMNQLATQRLNRVGVQSVFSSQQCTFSDPDNFYSYRRDGVTGRQVTSIWLE